MSVNVFKNNLLQRIAGKGVQDADFNANSRNGLQNRIITAWKLLIEGRITDVENDLTAKDISISNTDSNISIERYNATITGNILCINSHLSVTGQGARVFGVLPSNIELVTKEGNRYVDMVMTFDNTNANVAGYIDTEDNTIYVNSTYSGTAICSMLVVCPCRINA